MHKHFYLFLAFFLFQINTIAAQSGCPGCLVQLPDLPADTIFLGAAPDGVAGEMYDGDMSFRMPKTTNPVHDVDPGTPAGLNIGHLTIVALLNVPPGLSWEPNQFEFDPGNETDGCVKFCGTPLLPGMYEVEVFVTATVLTVNQSTSFPFSFYIAPATSTTDGFGLQNSSGCGEVTVGFENNIPSTDTVGFDYFWDFGNGTTSTEENPTDITYSTPGFYEINYEATIDTAGFELSTVQIVDASCNDFSLPPISNAPPELFIKIKDPSGNQIYQSPKLTNAPLPSAFNVNIPIMPGDYSLEVRDDDLIGSDHCGTVTFNRFSNDTLVDGDLKVLLNIFHPVFEVQSTDTVYVFEIPADPQIAPNGLVEVCEGEEVALVADYENGLQWFRDSTAILGATDDTLLVSENGIFWVEYTSPDGCKSISEQVEFSAIGLPSTPSFQASQNWLELNSPDLLPDDFALQWFINGDSIPDANEIAFCNTFPGANLFTLEVTDNATGCSKIFELGVAFDENSDCTVPTNDLPLLEQSLRIYPNPTDRFLNIEFENDGFGKVEIRVLDVVGKVVLSRNFNPQSARFYERLDLQSLASGIYFLEIKKGEGNVARSFVK